ncbi:Leucine-rich repeat containing protein [Heracleum sosnowskyi]|uniref:Leucine-rich repeat containing protein n=1 Tax=Heracleum sosnowskyi TaxID=360622 RepID=A0AAD8IXC3_9APIA|nr:Leucine-rich repeat containing protein [Heracleum sosnowskyi]KAK1393713.1 Leucine-rich repeat containing protein [Heracleum sosnowskyi]
MAEILSIVATPIVEKVIDVATSFIKSKIDLLQHLKGDVVKLESKLTMIRNVLKDAEDKQTGSHLLRDWLRKLEEAAYDAEDLLEMFETEAMLLQKKKQARTLPLSFTETRWKSGAARKIKNLLSRLEDIARETNGFGLEKIHADVPFFDRRTTYFVNETDVVGREQDMTKIIQMLISEELGSGVISVIPIIGMGGMGKTTLAQLIYNNETIENHFKVVMWAWVANKFDIKRILKEMIETHSKMKVAELDLLSLHLIESRLLDIISENRILVVLDDVWSVNYDEWEKLERLLKRAGKGSRVLITSRDSGVFSLNNPQTLYHLGRLPEDQCRSLFEKIAFIEGNSSGNLESIGQEIVQKCEGLPLAVKAVAGLLRGNTDIYKWKKIRDNPIWMAEQPKTRAQRATILPALKLSYDDLPSHIKKCFAHSYLFPKAYIFSKAELIKLWKGASLIPSTVTGSSIDETGSDCFDILLRMSFFELHKVHGKQYKMHDLIHDLAQSVSSPHFHQIQDTKSDNINEECRHVSLLCENAEQPLQNIIDKSVKLRTLLAPTDNLKNFGLSLDKLFRTVKYLRVLDLSKSTMLELPKSVGELKLLRYLNVSETEIRGLPDTICSLYHLETLKLLRCLWLVELPKKLGNMAKLQHIELDAMFWHKCYTLPPSIGNLTSLQNLHVFPINPDIGCDISELQNMNHLTGRLHISNLEKAKNTRGAQLMNKEKIEELVLEWSNQTGQQDEEAHGTTLQYLETHSNLEKLRLYNYMGARFPSWIEGGKLTNLVTLSLIHCTNCKVISLAHLPHLGEVKMKGLLKLEEWTGVQFNSLGRLQLSNCPKLRELPPKFNNLRVLKIKKCASVRVLPRTPLLMFLILIDNSELEDWNGEPLPVPTVNNQGQLTLSEFPSILSVLELKIENCPKMPLLPLLFAPQKLEIISCPLLTTLPIPKFSRRLQHLALVKCADGLINAIPETKSLYSLVISNISSLSSLPQLPNLPGLKSLHIHHFEDLVSLSQTSLLGLTALTYLSIRGCSKLMTLVDTELPKSLEVLSIDSCDALKSLGSDDLLKNLTSLKDLDIEDCQELLSLPQGGLPISLQHLRIEGCPLLLDECRENSGKYWPLIMHIPDLEIQF